jgi:gamma-glutamyltranspeptidase
MKSFTFRTFSWQCNIPSSDIGVCASSASTSVPSGKPPSSLILPSLYLQSSAPSYCCIGTPGSQAPQLIHSSVIIACIVFNI